MVKHQAQQKKNQQSKEKREGNLAKSHQRIVKSQISLQPPRDPVVEIEKYKSATLKEELIARKLRDELL